MLVTNVHPDLTGHKGVTFRGRPQNCINSFKFLKLESALVDGYFTFKNCFMAVCCDTVCRDILILTGEGVHTKL